MRYIYTQHASQEELFLYLAGPTNMRQNFTTLLVITRLLDFDFTTLPYPTRNWKTTTRWGLLLDGLKLWQLWSCEVPVNEQWCLGLLALRSEKVAEGEDVKRVSFFLGMVITNSKSEPNFTSWVLDIGWETEVYFCNNKKLPFLLLCIVCDIHQCVIYIKAGQFHFFPTPFDHFHFRPTLGLLSSRYLTVCPMEKRRLTFRIYWIWFELKEKLREGTANYSFKRN